MSNKEIKTNINFTQGFKNLIEETKSEKENIKYISDKISEFFNMKNINFLFGSGTSSGAIPTMNSMFEKAIDKIKKLDKTVVSYFEEIELKKDNNLEGLLGVLYSSKYSLESNPSKQDDLEKCSKLISTIENVIFDEINISINDSKYSKNLELYKSFYLKVALRNKDLSRINIFTTNNDLFNETALDNVNISFINGFNGGLNRFFNPAFFNYSFSKRMDTSIDKYEPVENMVYLYKIHGSINWIEDNSNTNTFFNIKEITSVENLVYDKNKNTLIYPTPTKQNKSLGSPYTELFREFQKKLLEPNSVLFVIGYSFSDEHVNNIIYQALATNSSINVVIFNNLPDEKIFTVNDSRIFKVYGEDSSSDKIHYFNYIIDNFLPDVNLHKSNNDILSSFINQIKTV